MPIELQRDMINFESLIGEGTGQMMVGGDIVLGDRSPEILNILNVDGKVDINTSECIDDKAVVEGKMAFELLYSSHGDNGCIYKVNAVSNFNHSIHVPGAKANTPCKINTRIDHINVDQVNNRKIKVNAIINLDGTVYEKNVLEAITDIRTSEIQVLKNSIMLDEFIGENSAQSIVRSHFDVTTGEINTILKRDAFVYKKDVQLEADKIVVNACARVKLMYDNVEGDTFLVEQDVVFTNEMEVKALRPTMKVDVSFVIKDSYDEIKENDEGKKTIIDSEMAMEICCKIYGKKEFENVVDAYSPLKRYDMIRETAKILSYFGNGTENESIRERIRLPEEVRAAKKIKNILVKPVLTDTKAVDNKIILEGVLNCCIIYIVAQEEGTLSSYEEDIAFKSVVEVPGVKIDMNVEAEINTYDLVYELVSDRNIDLRIFLISDTKAYSKNLYDISSNAVEGELPDNFKHMPSIVIYTVQPNDTLWKIAKKYNTTIEDIININDLGNNEEDLSLGRKILIPKKMLMK